MSIRIRDGETFALLGPSGTGKSVLLKHAVGLFDPDGGDVRVGGISVPLAGRDEIREVRSRVSYVFQDSALFDSITVPENVRIGLGTEARGAWRGEARSRVREALELVNLSEADGRKLPGELSGGMRKRVALARALVGDHTYMLYDEPTTGLDPINTAVTGELIRRCHREDECETDVLVTHDLQLAFSLADRAAVLVDGRVRIGVRPPNSGAPTIPSCAASSPEIAGRARVGRPTVVRRPEAAGSARASSVVRG